MPNHIHLLLTPLPGHEISVIMKSRKQYTATQANKILSRAGQFWQEDYFDRYIRDERHYLTTINYIETNPVKAGLCEGPADWPYSSARFRKQRES